MRYLINKFTFKIKESEHKIINAKFEDKEVQPETVGEMQVYAETSDGKRAVLAILMAIGEKDNEFIKNLNPKESSF